MRCYIDSGGHLDLCKQLNAEPILLYRSGSAHEFVINHLYDKLSGVPKALVVWGLSHTNRIDVPWEDDKKSMWATLNYDHLVGNDDIHDFHNIPKDDKSLNVFIDYLMQLLRHNHLYIKKSLEQILFVAGWLKSQGHDYLIWNQAARDFSIYSSNNIWPAIIHAKTDPGIHKIFSWYMNQALYDHGVPPRPDDLKYFKGEWNISVHPLECPELADFVNKFILENLQNRNLI
jgi:hypothetical protein